MALHNAQKEIARDTHRFRVLCCGRRFGKTVLAIEELVGKALGGPNRRVCYYAPTRDDAREIAWAILCDKCQNVTTYKNEQRLEMRVKTVGGGESSILLYGWESVQERGKGRGLANDLIVLDEAAFYRNFWEGWDEVLSPTLVDRRGDAVFISTPKGFNHFYELFNKQETDPDFKSFRFSTYDNPFIPVDEIEREKLSKPEDTFAQEYLADFRKAEGLVYPEFDRQRHVSADIPMENVARRLVGVDFGYTNPTAALLVLEMRDGRFWVAEEWYKAGRDTEEIVSAIRSMNPEAVYPDPAEPDRIELLRRAGLSIREVKKDVQWGIERVRSVIKQGRLVVHPRCVNLLDELATYRWKEGKSDKNAPDEPEKHHDHAADSLKYVLSMAIDDGGNDRAMEARVMQNRSRILSGR